MEPLSLTTPAQIDGFRVRMVIRAIDLYLKSDGRMILTRTARPADLRRMASEYTGKNYPRSRQGLESARNDLQALFN